nr:thioredoxin [uncultured Psychroserpens sp.]
MKNILTLLLIFSISTLGFSQTEITDDNAEAKILIDNDRLIVLDFYATWCGPCKRMDPIIKQLEEEYNGKVDFYKIDVDKNKIDDALEISSIPTYLFIKNSTNLEQIEGAMSKEEMKTLIEKHMGTSSETNVSNDTNSDFYSAEDNHGNYDEFSDDTVDELWNSSQRLNSLAWHTYKSHEDIKSLLKAIKIVKRSIELEPNYYNIDTHAALLYKTGNYNAALKKAKEAIDYAKEEGISYESTSELINKIIEEL